MTAKLRQNQTARPPPFDVVRRRNLWGIVGTAFLAVLLALAASSIARNENFQWEIVWHYLFDPLVLQGLARTVELTAISIVIGVIIGALLAVMSLSRSMLVRQIASAYIGVFRGTPLLVQLIFWYNIAALYPIITLRIPFFGPVFWSGSANDLVTPLSAAILGLSLHEAAYMSEIIRGAILGVDHGQTEAAESLGMSGRRIFMRIILPQAMRMIIPPTGNQVISMLKATSLVSVLSMTELLYTVQLIYSRTFQIIPLLIVACIWYFVLTYILTVIQGQLESYFGRGFVRRTARSRKNIDELKRDAQPLDAAFSSSGSSRKGADYD